MDKRLMLLMAIFFLSFSLFVGLIIFGKPLSRLIRAEEEFLPSGKASLIFAYPLTVKADGLQESTINVFIRSLKGIPIPNKIISLTTNLGSLKPTSITSSKEGKATFTIISSEKGVATIEAKIDNSTTLENKISVLFE